MPSAWGARRRDEIALVPDACPVCQGSCYIPAAPDDHSERIVRVCEACAGTGKTKRKRAA